MSPERRQGGPDAGWWARPRHPEQPEGLGPRGPFRWDSSQGFRREGLPAHVLALAANSGLKTDFCNRLMTSSKAHGTAITQSDYSGFSQKLTRKSLVTVTGHSGTRQLEQSDPVPGVKADMQPLLLETCPVCVHVCVYVNVPTTSFKYKHTPETASRRVTMAFTLTCEGHSLRPHCDTCQRLVSRARAQGCCRRVARGDGTRHAPWTKSPHCRLAANLCMAPPGHGAKI